MPADPAPACRCDGWGPNSLCPQHGFRPTPPADPTPADDTDWCWTDAYLDARDRPHVPADPTAAIRALQRSWDRLVRPHVREEPLLGCSTISHEMLGLCAGCTAATIEVLAWRLLTLIGQALDNEDPR